jgi:uncharacterized protein (TIGR02265 family)
MKPDSSKEARQVKGSHVRQAQEWVDTRLGANAFSELTKHAGPDWAVILPVGWYDVDVLNKALRAASLQLRVSVEDMVTEIARKNAERDLTSIYRAFLRVAQPHRVLSQTPRLWRTYVNFADARAVENAKGYYVGEGWGFSKDLVDWACGCWRGFIPATIVVAGGQQVKGRILERTRQGDGTYSVRFEVRYS